MKLKSRKAFHIIVLQNVFFLFCFGEGLQPRQPPSLLWVRQCRPTSSLALCYSLHLHTSDSTSVQMTTPEFAADTRLEFQAMIKQSESSGVKYSRRVVNFTSRLLHPRERPRWSLNSSLSWPLSCFERSEHKCLFLTARIWTPVRHAYSLYRLKYHKYLFQKYLQAQPKDLTKHVWF